MIFKLREKPMQEQVADLLVEIAKLQGIILQQKGRIVELEFLLKQEQEKKIPRAYRGIPTTSELTAEFSNLS